MRKKVLCIALALLMCMMVTVSAFADSSEKVLPDRALITVSFGLKHISGSTYRMWARINNPGAVSVNAILTLYNASYNPITAIGTTSSSTLIGLNKDVTLSSGTYHLQLSYTVDGVNHTVEKTYSI